MLIRHALDEPFALKGVEAVDGRLIGEDLAAHLDLANQRGLAVLAKVANNEVVEGLLFCGEGLFGQTGLRRQGWPWIMVRQNITIFPMPRQAVIVWEIATGRWKVVAAMSAIVRPIARQAVAAGEGTLRTRIAASCWTILKSSRSEPWVSSA